MTIFRQIFLWAVLLLYLLVGGSAGCALASEGRAIDVDLRLNTSDQVDLYGTVEAMMPPNQLAQIKNRRLDPEAWSSILVVYTGRLPLNMWVDPSEIPRVAGICTIEDGLLRFRPRYPLIQGLTYTARLDFSQLGADLADLPPVVAHLTLPAEEIEPSTFVRAIYPSSPQLPENLLRFYVHFSAPMTRGEAYERVRLLDESSGEEVVQPFVEISEELWDPLTRRLTLLFDPGRIKRGLRPHREAGPPLRQGRSYRLLISSDWRDGRGLPLVEGFEKRFDVRAPDRSSPRPSDWRVVAPRSGSRDAVTLNFSEALDHGLLMRVLSVRDARKMPLEGIAETEADETIWRWTPSAPWRAGQFTIEIDSLLEDLAGNNLRGAFDVDLELSAGQAEKGDKVEIPFSVLRHK